MDFLTHFLAALLSIPILGAALWVFELIGLALLSIVSAREVLRAKWRKATWGVAAILGFGLLGLIVADLFLFDPCVRYLVGRATAGTNLSIEFKEAKGSFLFGRFDLQGAHLRQGERLDLTADRAMFDVDMWGLFHEEIPIDLVVLEGAHGRVSTQKTTASKPRRAFRIESMKLSDVELSLEDPRFRVLAVPLRIETLELSLRSEELVWDLLCTAKGQVSLYGTKLTAKDGWHLDNISLDGLTDALEAPKVPAQADLGVTCPASEALLLQVKIHPSSRFLRKFGVNNSIRIDRKSLVGKANLGDLWDEVKSSWKVGL